MTLYKAGKIFSVNIGPPLQEILTNSLLEIKIRKYVFSALHPGPVHIVHELIQLQKEHASIQSRRLIVVRSSIYLD